MITSPDGRLRIERALIRSRTDLYDDDERWEIRIVDQETGAVVDTVEYFDNLARTTGVRVSSEPQKVGFSSDSSALEVTDADGELRRVRIRRSDDVAHRLTTRSGDYIEWQEVERTRDSTLYEVRWLPMFGTEPLGIWHHHAARRPDGGGWDQAPINRIVLSSFPGILALVRNDGHVEGYHYDHGCVETQWPSEFLYSPERWFKGTLLTRCLVSRGDGREPRSMLFVWSNRRHGFVTLITDRDLATGEWIAGPKPLMRSFRFRPDFAVEIDYEDGRSEVRPFRDDALAADRTFGFCGEYAFVWHLQSKPGLNLQTFDMEVMDLRSNEVSGWELDREGLDVTHLQAEPKPDGPPNFLLCDREGPLHRVVTGPDGP